MKIKVTWKHISEGTPCNINCCPLVLALKDVLSEDVKVWGKKDSQGPYAWMKGPFDFDYSRDVALNLPEVCRDFMETFDAGLPVKPFTFELAVS